MFNQNHVNALAAYTPSATAQKILAELYPQSDHQTQFATWGYLAQNPDLTPELWKRLWKKLGYNDPNSGGYWVESMLRSAPTLADANFIFKLRDKRVIEYIEAGSHDPRIKPMPKEIMAQLQSSKRFANGTFAAALINSGELPDELLLPYWDKVLADYLDSLTTEDGLTLHSQSYDDYIELTALNLAMLYKSLSDEQLLLVLKAESIGSWEAGSKIVDVRPSLIPLMLTAENPERFYYAVAKSRHTTQVQAQLVLDGAIALALATAYPRVDAIEQLAGNIALPAAIRLAAHNFLGRSDTPAGRNYADQNKAIMRKLAKDAAAGKLPPKSPWEALEGAGLEELKEELGARVLNYPTLDDLERFNNYHQSAEDIALSEEFVVNTLSPRLDALGAVAWQLFIGMLDGWNSSLEDLLKVVDSTVVK